MKKINGKHILLTLLYSKGKSKHKNEPIIGRIRLVKMMFLFDKEIRIDFTKDKNIEICSFPEFYSWDYGPFSSDVYNDIEFFLNNGFIETTILNKEKSEIELEEEENWLDEEYLFKADKENHFSNFRCVESFKLSNLGIKYVEQNIVSILSDNQIEILKEFKNKINSANYNSIIRYTYMKYPEFTSKSKLKGNKG